ncbi:MAG: hypothetical protein IJJ88_05430 [Oscillospiraceae bacterium]|nr:hypothetical protein [Oscillospiraceae bacterium]
MRRFFLVDYENVSDGGLHGFFDLTGDDTVALFYTQNANKISIDFFEIAMRSDKAANIAFIKVNPGNQALDLQLASYLGALMASAEDDCAFYIVSKDKGFQCLIPFWSAHHGGTPLYQVRSIQEAIQPDGTATAEVKPARAARPQQKPVPQPAKQPEKAPETQPEAAAEAEAAPLVEDKPQPPAPESSTTPVKPKKAAKAKSPSAASAGKAAANNMVQQVLSKAKVDSPDIAFMASLVSKHTGQEKMKQTVYRSTIAKFGQKRGLEIYNLVKSLLK